MINNNQGWQPKFIDNFTNPPNCGSSVMSPTPPSPIPKERLWEIPDMDYKSPIKIHQEEIKTKMENGIFEVVQSYGISVDKTELVKALKYDRQQYNKGFRDGIRKFAEMMREELIMCDRVFEGYGAYIDRKGYEMEDVNNAVDNIEKGLMGEI